MCSLGPGRLKWASLFPSLPAKGRAEQSWEEGHSRNATEPSVSLQEEALQQERSAGRGPGPRASGHQGERRARLCSQRNNGGLRAGLTANPGQFSTASSSFEIGGMSPHYGIRVNPKDIVLVKEACRKWPGLTLNQIIFKHTPPSSIMSEVLLVYSEWGGRLFQACSCQGVHWEHINKKGKRKHSASRQFSRLTSFCFQMAELGMEARASNMLCEYSPSISVPSQS